MKAADGNYQPGMIARGVDSFANEAQGRCAVLSGELSGARTPDSKRNQPAFVANNYSIIASNNAFNAAVTQEIARDAELCGD